MQRLLIIKRFFILVLAGLFFLAVFFSPIRSGVAADGYFKCNEINYFTICQKKEKKEQKPAPKSKQPGMNAGETGVTFQEWGVPVTAGQDTVQATIPALNGINQKMVNEYIRLFGNPVINSKGEVNYSLPSLPVLKYTANPTKENAREVARWYKERSERLLAMMKTIKDVTTEKEYPTIKISDLEKVTFYFSPTCPYSKAMVPQMNEINRYAEVTAYTETKNIDALIEYKQTLGPQFKIYKVTHNVLADNGVTSVPTITWVTKDKGAYKTVGFKQYLKRDGTVDLRYSATSKEKSSCQ